MKNEHFGTHESMKVDQSENDKKLIEQLFNLSEGTAPTDEMVAAFERSSEFQEIMANLEASEATFERVMQIVQSDRKQEDPGFESALARILADRAIEKANPKNSYEE